MYFKAEKSGAIYSQSFTILQEFHYSTNWEWEQTQVLYTGMDVKWNIHQIMFIK